MMNNSIYSRTAFFFIVTVAVATFAYRAAASEIPPFEAPTQQQLTKRMNAHTIMLTPAWMDKMPKDKKRGDAIAKATQRRVARKYSEKMRRQLYFDCTKVGIITIQASLKKYSRMHDGNDKIVAEMVYADAAREQNLKNLAVQHHVTDLELYVIEIEGAQKNWPNAYSSLPENGEGYAAPLRPAVENR